MISKPVVQDKRTSVCQRRFQKPQRIEESRSELLAWGGHENPLNGYPATTQSIRVVYMAF